jgi:Nitroreductase family
MLYCDPDRLLRQTDPFSRQIIIGLGAFVETFVITAMHLGRDVSVSLFPEGFPSDRIDGRPVARLALGNRATASDPLFHQILKRRSVKAPYDMQRSVPDAAIIALNAEMRKFSAAFALESEPTRLTQFREIMLKSGLIEVNTPHTWRESVDLMRIGTAENIANPDGISIMGPHIDRLFAAGQISRAMMADTSSPGFRAATERYSASINGTPAVVWYATANNTREDQIAAGRLWMRLSLTATQFGLGMHPMSQALQEFEEMREVLKDLHRFLGVEQPRRVQMLARLGYGPDVAPTPRWAASTRIRKP